MKDRFITIAEEELKKYKIIENHYEEYKYFLKVLNKTLVAQEKYYLDKIRSIKDKQRKESRQRKEMIEQIKKGIKKKPKA